MFSHKKNQEGLVSDGHFWNVCECPVMDDKYNRDLPEPTHPFPTMVARYWNKWHLWDDLSDNISSHLKTSSNSCQLFHWWLFIMVSKIYFLDLFFGWRLSLWGNIINSHIGWLMAVKGHDGQVLLQLKIWYPILKYHFGQRREQNYLPLYLFVWSSIFLFSFFFVSELSLQFLVSFFSPSCEYYWKSSL